MHALHIRSGALKGSNELGATIYVTKQNISVTVLALVVTFRFSHIMHCDMYAFSTKTCLLAGVQRVEILMGKRKCCLRGPFRKMMHTSRIPVAKDSWATAAIAQASSP